MSMFRDFIDLFSPPTDDMIDVMIAERGCKSYRKGMDKPDMNILKRNGTRRWNEVAEAQENLGLAVVETVH